MHLTHLKYRPDIDGLRAVAIISVVIFHAFPTSLTGGFVGVDIFFVISGFLISSIIFSSLERSRFSLSEFYGRRIRRIFPALVLVLAASFIFGWLVLLADEFKQLGNHIAAGSTFLSNIILLLEVGYFDNASVTKPLLHLWSLAIEEQFYIFWPILLVLAWKRSRQFLFITLLVAAISFSANIVLSTHNPSAAFYLPISRAWELMIGGILAYISLHSPNVLGKRKNLQAAIGVVLLSLSILQIDSGDTFPGWWALLPTIGTFLVISAGMDAWINRHILSSKILVLLGLISYPLYLWHWPLLSFARILKGDLLTSLNRAALVVLAFVLAYLTYRFVEKPIRNGRHPKRKLYLLVSLMSVLCMVGFISFDRGGFSFRYTNQASNQGSAIDSSDLPVVDYPLANPGSNSLFQFSVRDSRQTERFALLGDSKASALFPGLIKTSFEDGRWLFIGGNKNDIAPVPVLSDAEIYRPYQSVTKLAVDSIADNKNIEVVVIATATRKLFKLESDSSIDELPFSPYSEIAYDGMSRVIGQLVSHGKKVVLLVDNPTLASPKDCLQRHIGTESFNKVLSSSNPKCSMSIKHYLELSGVYRNLLQRLQNDHPSAVSIFDATPILCDTADGICASYKDGKSMYAYTDHISNYAAEQIGIELNKRLTNRK